MDASKVSERQLKYLSFVNREKTFRHHYYDEEMRQYELLKAGDSEAIEESKRMFSSPTLGHLSDDPVKNLKYLFIASVTLATRFSIEGGLDSETAYNASDLFIQKLDSLTTLDEVRALNTEMFTLFVKLVTAQEKKGVYSKPIIQCVDYIYFHLHEQIRLSELAENVGLNASYLSALFKREMGRSFSDYILDKRIEAAENMLKHSDYTYAEISAYLAFSSQSYFGKLFKARTGYTPKAYRSRFFRLSFDE